MELAATEKVVDKYKWNFQNHLGSGSYAKVYYGEDTEKNFPVAIKIMDSKLLQNQHLKQGIQKEIKIMKSLDSKFITKLYDVCLSKNNIYLIIEYCKDGDLRKYLNKKKKDECISEKEAFSILHDIIRGYKCLVERKIIHRDLKPENILYHEGIFKLSDFGFSKTISEMNSMLESIVGSPLYMSPQLLQCLNYCPKSDIWSIGVIYYEILCGKTPWPSKTQYELVNRILNEPLKFPYQIKISKASEKFIKKTLEVDEPKRISWEGIFKHELFAGKEGSDLDTNGTNKGPVNTNAADFDQKTVELVKNIQNLITEKKININALFSKLDKSKDNLLDFQEFAKFINLIDPEIDKEMIKHVFQKIDSDKSESLNLTEFKVLLSEKDFTEYIMYKDPYIDKKAERVIKRLKKEVQDNKISIQKLFDTYDYSQNHMLEFDELHVLLKKIDKTITKVESEYIFTKFDFNKDRVINIEEFESIFIAASPTKVFRRKSEFSKESVAVDKLKRASIRIKLDIKKEFEALTNNSDFINFQQFETYIKKLDNSISTKEIMEIFKFVDHDEDGLINFLEFQQVA